MQTPGGEAATSLARSGVLQTAATPPRANTSAFSPQPSLPTMAPVVQQPLLPAEPLSPQQPHQQQPHQPHQQQHQQPHPSAVYQQQQQQRSACSQRVAVPQGQASKPPQTASLPSASQLAPSSLPSAFRAPLSSQTGAAASMKGTLLSAHPPTLSAATTAQQQQQPQQQQPHHPQQQQHQQPHLTPPFAHSTTPASAVGPRAFAPTVAAVAPSPRGCVNGLPPKAATPSAALAQAGGAGAQHPPQQQPHPRQHPAQQQRVSALPAAVPSVSGVAASSPAGGAVGAFTASGVAPLQPLTARPGGAALVGDLMREIRAFVDSEAAAAAAAGQNPGASSGSSSGSPLLPEPPLHFTGEGACVQDEGFAQEDLLDFSEDVAGVLGAFLGPSVSVTTQTLEAAVQLSLDFIDELVAKGLEIARQRNAAVSPAAEASASMQGREDSLRPQIRLEAEHLLEALQSNPRKALRCREALENFRVLEDLKTCFPEEKYLAPPPPQPHQPPAPVSASTQSPLKPVHPQQHPQQQQPHPQQQQPHPQQPGTPLVPSPGPQSVVSGVGADPSQVMFRSTNAVTPLQWHGSQSNANVGFSLPPV